MAGYKRSLLKTKPDCLLTFDGESFFDSGGYLRYPHLHDETGNENHGLVDTTNAEVKSYSGRMLSLVPREASSDQYSFCFAPRSYDTNMPFPYDKSLVEIMPKENINLKDEFTFMFLFKKTDDDSWFRSRLYNTDTNTYYVPNWGIGKSINRTLFIKGVSVGCYYRYTYGWYPTLEFIFPDQNFSWRGWNSNFEYGRTYHITMTRRKTKIGAATYQTTNTVYVDGRTIYSFSSNITSNPSTAFNTASIFIGGNKSEWNYDTLDDRQTTPLYIDNFTIWNRCLSNIEVANLYKKVFTYKNYTQRMYPYLFTILNDNLSVNNNRNTGTLLNNGSNSTLMYHGTATQIYSGKEYPLRLMYDSSTTFSGGGMARIYTNNGVYPTINSSGDWTLDFFVKIDTYDRGVILSAQSDYFPFKGVLIEANTADNTYRRGAIQVTLEDNVYISTSRKDSFGNYVEYSNTGSFHHICVIRRNNRFEFWLNGSLVSDIYSNSGDMIPAFGTMYLMGMMPDNSNISGSMCMLSYFQYAMEAHNIRARSFFYTKNRIQGRITLKGIPHEATIRVMDHDSGKLIIEDTSDPNTGLYDFDIYTDEFIDIVVLDKKDKNVRYRSFGPIVASEYTDIDSDDIGT